MVICIYLLLVQSSIAQLRCGGDFVVEGSGCVSIFNDDNNLIMMKHNDLYKLIFIMTLHHHKTKRHVASNHISLEMGRKCLAGRKRSVQDHRG